MSASKVDSPTRMDDATANPTKTNDASVDSVEENDGTADSARGEDAEDPPETSVDRCIRMLSDIPQLVEKQLRDRHLNAVRVALLEGEETSEGPHISNEYVLDDQDLVWKTGKGSKARLAIPQSLVPDLLALVHAQHGHPGVAGTTALLKERFHGPHLSRGARDCALSCGCRLRKRSRSQQIAMLPSKILRTLGSSRGRLPRHEGRLRGG